MTRYVVVATVACAVLAGGGPVRADLRDDARETLAAAVAFFHDEVSVNGGYVYFYSPDLSVRWGEGKASPTQIWVQPPGTPTVGLAYLRAYEATGDGRYLDAAKDAAMALVYGQLESGGWTNSIDFDPAGRVAQYRNGKGGGKNNSSLDDGQTQSAIEFLVRADGVLKFENRAIHEAAAIALDALLAAQFPNGGFPQVWTGPVAPQPVSDAKYPDYDWRTEGRIKEYWDYYTLNDGLAGDVAEALATAYEVYEDDKYSLALERLGGFLVRAHMPEPQPAWAQQYNYQMQPIWARKFEPAAIAGTESQGVIATLMDIAVATRNEELLAPIPRALAYLERSRLPDGRLARYYELESNRPLYMEREGGNYQLTYDDSNLPSHYGWKTDSRLDALRARHTSLVSGNGEPVKVRSERSVLAEVKRICDRLDARGRWLSIAGGERLVGQAKFPVGEEYISSQRFAKNVTLLSEYLDD